MKNIIRLSARFLKFKRFVLPALLLTVLQCALQLCLPVLMAEVVNGGVMRGELNRIYYYGGWMIAVCFLLAVSGYFAKVLTAVGAERFALELRRELYEKVSGMSVFTVSQFGVGTLITRLTSDVECCSALMGAFLQITLQPLLLMIGGIVMVWRRQQWLGGIFTGFAVVQIVLMVLFVRSTAPKFRWLRELNDRCNELLQEVFSRLRLVKILTREPRETERFGDLNNTVLLAGISVQKVVAVFQPMMMFIVDCAVAVILLFARNNAALSAGALMETISYAQQVLLSIVIGGRLFQFLSEAVPSAARMSEVFQTEADLPDGEEPIESAVGCLELRDVSFGYFSSKNVIEQISFDVKRGTFTAVTGATGSGKSVIADLCARLLDVREGAVLIDGCDIADFRLADVRRHIAVVEKQESVISGTYYENISFGRDYVSAEDVEKAALAAQCAPMIESSPEGYEGEIYAMGRSLSGGERQRLAIARALAGQPDILLLDDCTSSLDHDTEAKLFRAIRTGYPQMAVVLFTQRTVSASLAERIICLDGGRIVDVGTDAELKANCEAYRSLCPANAQGGTE